MEEEVVYYGLGSRQITSPLPYQDTTFIIASELNSSVQEIKSQKITSAKDQKVEKQGSFSVCNNKMIRSPARGLAEIR